MSQIIKAAPSILKHAPSIIKTVKKLAPTILKAAPTIIKHAPSIIKTVKTLAPTIIKAAPTVIKMLTSGTPNPKKETVIKVKETVQKKPLFSAGECPRVIRTLAEIL